MISPRRRPSMLRALLVPGMLAHRVPVAAARRATPTAAGAVGWAEACAISDAGQIVLSDGRSAAILTPDGEVLDLGGLSFPDGRLIPPAINNRGRSSARPITAPCCGRTGG